MSSSYQPSNTYILRNSETDDDKFAILKFSYCNKKYPLEKLTKNELKSFVDYAKKIEKMIWREIKTSTSLNYETLKNLVLPIDVNDATAVSMRINRKFRIIGWREKEFFNIVWFDNNHKTC